MKNIKEKIEIIGAILFAVGFWVVLIWLLNKGCNTDPKPTNSNKDSLNTIIAEKEYLIESIKDYNLTLNTKIDSLSHLKPKVIVRYKTVYDSLLVIDTMCVDALNTLHNEHTKIDSVNNQIINAQSKAIANDSIIMNSYSGIIAIQKTIIKSDSLTIEDLTMTVKKEKRKGKIRTILGTALGVLGGIGIGSLR